MSQLIELPDPLYAEINGYATRAATSPLGVVRQAWEEFRTRHPQETAGPLPAKPSKEELLAMVRSLTGSLSLPQDADYDEKSDCDRRDPRSVGKVGPQRPPPTGRKNCCGNIPKGCPRHHRLPCHVNWWTAYRKGGRQRGQHHQRPDLGLRGSLRREGAGVSHQCAGRRHWAKRCVGNIRE